ncbi:MAG: fibronectin type III domain-containing protein [Elusimicrobia bacterium]|nr:fibronectin type III domain-containing protein [Elusimicrobiota bacterium]
MMRFRDRLLWGLPLAVSLPVSALAQNVTVVNGVALDTGRISYTWNFVSGANCYQGVDQNNVAFQVAPVGANPPDNAFILTGLLPNTTHSINVGARNGGTNCGDGTLQNPLFSGVTVYTLAEQPKAVNGPCGSSPICSVSRFGFTGDFNTMGNNTQSKFRSQAVNLRTNAVTNLGDITNQNANTVGQVNFATAEPNTSYRLETSAVNGGSVANGLGQNLQTAFSVLGTSTTHAAAPTTLTVVSTGPSTIGITWNSNLNPNDTEYLVQYSSQGFASGVFTAFDWGVPSLAGYPTLGLTVTGLLTNKTYEIRVTARNSNHALTTPASVTGQTAGGSGNGGDILYTLPSGNGAQIRGTVGTNLDRPVSLDIVAGTFDQTVQILVSTRTAVGGNCGTVDAAYTITVSPPLQPRFPVRLGLGVALNPLQAGLTDSRRVTISRLDDATGACVPLATTVGVAANMAFAETNHFSSFVIQQVNPGDSLSKVRIFPNPFFPRKQGQLTIDGMPGSARLRVYTLHGEELFDGEATGSGVVNWNGRNKLGQQVASGLYLVLVNSGGDKRVMKLVVVR